jgi:hypothetical protein
VPGLWESGVSGLTEKLHGTKTELQQHLKGDRVEQVSQTGRGLQRNWAAFHQPGEQWHGQGSGRQHKCTNQLGGG